MKFTIVVYAAPYSSQSAATAFNFSKTLLSEGHEIYRLFFFSDGAHNTNKLARVPQGETNLQASWDDLIRDYDLDSAVCVSSAIKRGIADKQEAERHELSAVSLFESSDIAGLGQLIDAAINSDRLLNFG